MAASDDDTDLALLTSFAREAAALALTFFGQAPKSWTKSGNSPVSEADIAIDRLLHDGLRAARPAYGWLSEEAVDSAERLSADTLFVVDPIDGTRAFLAGQEDWTVSLAVVREGRPVAACLVAPVRNIVFEASRGRGTFIGSARLAVSTLGDAAKARVASPKAHVGVTLPAFAEAVPRIASLALRLASVANQHIDAAFAGPGAKDWDIAAADLIVTEAGGRLSDFSGHHPLYNRPDPSHPALLAAGPALHDVLLTSRS